MFPVLSPIDFAIILVYVVGLLYLGLRQPESGHKSNTGYLLGGRRLTLIPFVATLVSTWYGGILGVGEFTWSNGVVNLLVFAFPYYLFAIIYASWLARKIQSGTAITIPERFRQSYGHRSARLSALLVFLLTTPAPYLLMLGVLLNLVTGIDLRIGLLLGTLFSTVYLWRGGFRSVVRTDLLQFGLMFIGFIVLLIALANRLPIIDMWQSLPEGHRLLGGGPSMSWQIIFVWFLVASWTFVDPGFYQRCVAAQDGSTAAKGIFISVGIWFIFDILTTVTALYAVVLLPDLATHPAGPIAAYPLLGAQVLLPGMRGLFVVALLAVVMSTVDSFTFISATTLGRDFTRKAETDENETRRIQLGILITASLGLLLAWMMPSVVGLWYLLGTLLVPGLLVPTLVSFMPRYSMTDNEALSVGISGIAVSAAWHIMNVLLVETTVVANIQPMIPGLLVSGVFGLIIIGKHSATD